MNELMGRQIFEVNVSMNLSIVDKSPDYPHGSIVDPCIAFGISSDRCDGMTKYIDFLEYIVDAGIIIDAGESGNSASELELGALNAWICSFHPIIEIQ